MAATRGEKWVVTMNVRLSDPITEVQQRNLERALLAVDVRSPLDVRLHVAVQDPSLTAAIDAALQVCREALVMVDAWFERVDLFHVESREEWPWEPRGDTRPGAPS